MKKKQGFGLATGGTVVLVATFALIAGTTEKGASKTALPISTAAVEQRDINVRVEAAGSVEAVRTIEVKSRASGEVRSVLVESGDQVSEGMLLAEIDPRDVRNAYEQTAADLESARVKVQTTAAQLSRMEELRQSNAVTQQEYETAQDAAASARSALVRAQTNVELSREKLGDVTIRAPISGTVIERTVEPGQIIASATGNVSGGTTLLRIADLAQMRVRTLVDETDIGRIAAGQPAQVSVEAYPDRVFRGTVEKIEPQAIVDQNVTMFPVLVRLANPDGLLKPGMNAEVTVQVASAKHAAAVPNAALVTPRSALKAAQLMGVDEQSVQAALKGAPRSNTAIVFVKDALATEPRRVTTGLSDWDYTEIKSGLAPGEQVVLATVAQLKQNQQQDEDRMRQRAGGLVPGAGAARTGR